MVEQVYVPIELIFVLPTLFDKHVKLVFVLPIQIAMPHDTFKQHLPKTFFQPEMGEIAIDKTLVQERVQNLCITSWTIIEEE